MTRFPAKYCLARLLVASLLTALVCATAMAESVWNGQPPIVEGPLLAPAAQQAFSPDQPVVEMLLGSNPPSPDAVILPGMPADYDWWNGCSPTAAGMLFGYWDEQGYEVFPGNHRNLPATYPNTSSNSSDYDDARGVVAGWAHKQEGINQGLSYGSWQNHAPESLADFMKTSNGGTSRSNMAHGFEMFAAWDDPDTSEIESSQFEATTLYSAFDFARYQQEIDAGRPVHVGLSSSSGGHSVLGVGYNNTDGAENLVLLTTWHWGPQEWQWTDETYSGFDFSVYGGTLLEPIIDPVPELSAYLSIAHERIGDLEVELGVGDPASPDWSTTVWNQSGGTSTNLVLTDIDVTDLLDDIQTQTLDWYLKVTDHSDLLSGSEPPEMLGDTGTIEDFQIRYNFDEIVFDYIGSPVTISSGSSSQVTLESDPEAFGVPEPASLFMLLAAVGFAITARRRR